MKKLVSLLMALAMLLSCVSFASAEEPVTITWFGVGATSDHQERINAAASKYLQDKGINANIEIIKLSWGDWTQTYQVMMAAQEKFDLINGPGNTLMQYGLNGALVEFTDEMLDTVLSGVKAAASPAIFNALRHNGTLYAVPAMHEWAQWYGFSYLNLDITEELGLMEELKAVETLDDLDPIFAKVKAAYPDVYPFMLDGEPTMVTDRIGYLNHDESTLIGIDYSAPGTNFFSYLENEKVIEVFRKVNEWYKLGYINPDPTVSETSLRDQGKIFCQLARFKPGSGAQATTSSARYTSLAWDEEAAPLLTLKDAPAGWGTGLSKTSHNQEIALQVLNAAYDDPAFLNLLVFGEEGTDYTFNADGFVEMLDGGYAANVYTSNTWQYGNQHLNYVAQSYADLGLADIWQQQEAFNLAAVATEPAGFFFDNTNVDIEVAALATVSEEYLGLFKRGAVEDFDATLAEFVKKLNDNGLQTVIDEANAQYAEFLANK